MRKLAIATALSLTLLGTTTACACEPWATTSSTEVEDCDAEDYRNKEDDCGFTDADRRKTTKPTPARTPARRRS